MATPVISAKLDALEPAQELAACECLSDEDVLAFASGTLEPSRQLEAHLHFDQCEVCQRLLSEAAHALATAVTLPTSEAEELRWHTTFQPGTLVGHRYLIRRFIARGGMGEVYEAFDRELQEQVALKTVTSTACDNAGAVRRLKAEVQLARRVSHPNVCRIYDFGTHVMPETNAQLSFLTMEFVDGETLGQRVRLTGALPVEEARRLGRELLSGLCAAHEAGVLHRDFKSDNVMLRDNPGGGCSPLILDFGLARALDARSHQNSSSTRNLLGTFGYIAPEQLQGEPHTTASDIYSFGLVWFEMLTGELPFESPSSPFGSALARLRGDPVAPSSVNPRVPSDLDAVVLRCLRRSPKDRYKTAREVLVGLDTLESRARRRPQRLKLHPLLVGALLGGVVAYLATDPAKHPPMTEARILPNLPASPPTRAPSAAPPTATAEPRSPDAEPMPPSPANEKPAIVRTSHAGRRPKPTEPPPASTTAADSPTSEAPATAAAPTPVAPATTASPVTTAVPAQDNTAGEPTRTKRHISTWENPFATTSAQAGRGAF